MFRHSHSSSISKHKTSCPALNQCLANAGSKSVNAEQFVTLFNNFIFYKNSAIDLINIVLYLNTCGQISLNVMK